VNVTLSLPIGLYTDWTRRDAPQTSHCGRKKAGVVQAGQPERRSRDSQFVNLADVDAAQF